MATRNDDVKSAAASKKTEATSARVEDEPALRRALIDASLRVKRLAQKETEAETAGEEILHFRLKGG